MTRIERLEAALANAQDAITQERAVWGRCTHSGMVRSMNKISDYEATARYIENKIQELSQ